MYNKRPRLNRSRYLGQQRYFLTFCADGRHLAFNNRDNVATALAQFLLAAADRAFAIITYTFMPDHVHLLVEGTDATSDLCSFVHLAKQRSGHAYSQAAGKRLWQPSYWDRVLRDEESTWDVARYICGNAVRKGLAEKWDDYEFLGSGMMTREEFVGEMASHPATSWQP